MGVQELSMEPTQGDRSDRGIVIPASVHAGLNVPMKRQPSRSLSSPPSHEPDPVFKLELMKMGPDHSYLCLIPPEPPISDNPSHLGDSSEETTLIQSWNLLQALSGKCLYVSSLRFAFVPLFPLNDDLSPFSTDRAGLHILIATIPTFANSEKRHTHIPTTSVSPFRFPHSSLPLLNSYLVLPLLGYKPEEDKDVCPLSSPLPRRRL